jgi:hypothetical protein
MAKSNVVIVGIPTMAKPNVVNMRTLMLAKSSVARV